MNDRDIRKFIKENGIKVHDSGKFMREVIRQIELLPPQSTLDENEKNIRWLKVIFEVEAKYNRRNAVFTALVNLTVMIAVVVVLLYLLPLAGGTNRVVDLALSYRYLILSALCLMLSANTLLNFSKKI